MGGRRIGDRRGRGSSDVVPQRAADDLPRGRGGNLELALRQFDRSREGLVQAVVVLTGLDVSAVSPPGPARARARVAGFRGFRRYGRRVTGAGGTLVSVTSVLASDVTSDVTSVLASDTA